MPEKQPTSELFKEAIADAKAVRQTALANAKVALEEAFTERYKAMFAEKLKEEAEQDEASAPAAEETKGASEEAVSEQEIDELIHELEAEVGEEPAAEPEGAAAPPPPAVGAVPPAPPFPGAVPPPVPGAVPPGCPPVGAPPLGAPVGVPPVGGEMPPMGAAPMGAPMGAPPVGGEMPPTDAGATPPPTEEPAAGGAPEEDEEFDLNELLESLKEEIESEEEGKEEEEEEAKLDENTKLKSSGIGGSKAGGSPNKQPQAAAKSSSKIESAAQDKVGQPKLDQPKTVAKEATQASRPNKATHATKDNLSTPGMGKGNGSGGQTEDGMPSLDQPKTTAKEPTAASRPNQAKNATKDNLSTPGGMLEENQALRKQLNEAEEVIRYVKGQLNEVNLLNAKLLYTNKLFKEYSLTNEQKMRIVEMFDLAKNVREVKLTYANTAEALNFGAGDIRKKAKASANAQAITEGLASQPVGSTKPNTKQIITEASNMASRFQKLAGIKKPSK